MAFQYYEGTMDFVAATPAMIVTFRASGSLTAGRAAVYDKGGSGDVYQIATAAGIISGATTYVPAGVTLQTVTDGQEVAVLVWGYAKNLPYYGNSSAIPGNPVVMSGASYWSTSGSTTESLAHCGKVVTGSASGGTILAFIDCMT